MSYPESKIWDITQYKLWQFKSTPIMEVSDIMSPISLLSVADLELLMI